MRKTIVIIILFIWHTFASAMVTPDHSSFEQSSETAPLVHQSIISQHNPMESGCWNCFSDRYIYTGTGTLSGCWIGHPQLYRFCLPCIRQGGKNCSGFCGLVAVVPFVGVGLVAIGMLIYEGITHHPPDHSIPPQLSSNHSQARRMVPTCFRWGLSPPANPLAPELAVTGWVVDTDEAEERNDYILSHSDLFPRTYLLLCQNAVVDFYSCVEALDKEQQVHKRRLSKLELFLGESGWRSSKQIKVLPSLWGQWFSEDAGRLCLHSGKIVKCQGRENQGFEILPQTPIMNE